jgi:preprotein translocase subunit SecD
MTLDVLRFTLLLDESIILTDRVVLDSSMHSKIRKLEAYLKVAQDNYAQLLNIQLLDGLSEKQVNEIRSELTAAVKQLEKINRELKKLKEDPEDAEIKEAVNKFPIDEETREIMYEFADKVLEAKDKRIEELEEEIVNCSTKENSSKVPNIDRDEETLRQLKLLEGTKEVYSDDLVLVSDTDKMLDKISPELEDRIKFLDGKLKLQEEIKKKLNSPPSILDETNYMHQSSSNPPGSEATEVDLVIKDIGDNTDSDLRNFATNLIQYDNSSRTVAIVSKEKPGFSWIIKSQEIDGDSLPEIEISIAMTDFLCGPVAWIKTKL